MFAMQCMLVYPNITINRGVPVLPKHCTMQLPPHSCTVSQVVVPIHIETSVLPRHDLLMADRLGPIWVEEPFQMIFSIEYARQLGVVAL